MKEIKNQIINEIDDNSIKDLSSDIKKKYLDKNPIPWYKRPKFYAIASPIVLASITLAIVLPITLNQNIVTPVALKSPSQKIAFSILTTGNYLDSLENSNILNNIRRSHPPIAFITEEQFENQIDDVHPYVITANEMLKNNFSVDAEIKYDEATKLYTMTVSNYLFTYTQTPIANEDSNEEEFVLSGNLFVDGDTYEVYGERSIEIEQDEKEEEFFLKVNMSQNEAMIFEQETSIESGSKEETYSYTLIENNQIVTDVEISFEHQARINKVEIELFKNNTVSNYLIHENRDDNTILHMNYKIEELIGIFDVYTSMDSYRYVDNYSKLEITKNI